MVLLAIELSSSDCRGEGRGSAESEYRTAGLMLSWTVPQINSRAHILFTCLDSSSNIPGLSGFLGRWRIGVGICIPRPPVADSIIPLPTNFHGSSARFINLSLCGQGFGYWLHRLGDIEIRGA